MKPEALRKDILSFLGARTLRLLLAALALGLGLFVAETLFAFGLQSLLVEIGLMPADSVAMPHWMPRHGRGFAFAFLIVVGTLKALLGALQIYLQGAGDEKLKEFQRNRLLRWAFFSDGAGTAKVTNLFNSHMSAAGAAISNIQTLIIQTTLALLLAVSLWAMAPLLTAVLAGVLAALILPLRLADRRIGQAGRGLTLEWGKANSRLIMSLKNILLIQIYGTQAEEEASTRASLTAYGRHVLSYYAMAGLKFALPQSAAVALVCALALVAGSSPDISKGVLVSYFYLVLRFTQVFTAANQAASATHLYWPQLKNLFQWWQANRELADSVTPAPTAPDPRDAIAELPGWKVSDVSFSFPETAGALFTNLDLEIKPGETLVLQGPSGCGKTTLLRLLLGGVTPTAGSIEIYSAGRAPTPLQDCRKALLAAVGYVGPESFLIEGSIRDNLLYGLRRAPSEAEIEEALEHAECQFVSELSKKLEHRLTEQGQGLSAGQKQRLGLARAILRRPRVLVLDEATSNLDPDTEARIVRTLSRLKEKMTIIASTHRQELLKIADQFLDLGKEKINAHT